MIEPGGMVTSQQREFHLQIVGKTGTHVEKKKKGKRRAR
jgi:hypothetical protein